MKTKKPSEIIRRIYAQIKATLRQVSEKYPRNEQRAAVESKLENPQSVAYRLIGERTKKLLPLFRDLELSIQRSGLKVNLNAYVSLTVFASLLMAGIALSLIPVFLTVLLGISILPAILFGFGGSLFALAFTTIGFYFYPTYRSDCVKRGLEDELPFTTGYMAILTSAGVSPEKIFCSLSELSPPLAVSYEAKNVVRDVNLFGADIISALEHASRRTPSKKFREMLEGFISTIHSGGNSTAYLQEKTRQYMRLKRIGLKKFTDTLSILSEFYVTLLLTGPLLMVIMLTIMSMLGGGNLGIVSPDFLLSLLTYLGLPLGVLVFLIILDASSPKW